MTHKGALRTRLSYLLALSVLLTSGVLTLARPAASYSPVLTASRFMALTAAGNAGTITAAQGDVRLNLIDAGTVAVTLSGTWSATVQFEGTVNGSDWFAVNAYPPTALSAVTSATANGNWIVPCAGLGTLRIRSSAFTSGTIVVTLRNAVASFFAPGSAGGTFVADTELPAAAALGDADPAAPVTPTVGAAQMILDAAGPNLTRVRAAKNLADNAAGGTFSPSGMAALNASSNWDRVRTAPGATGTTGTGLLAEGPLLFDVVGGVNYIRQAGDGSGRSIMVGAAATGAATTGNPVLAGVSDSAGNTATLLLQSAGASSLRTWLFDGTNPIVSGTAADGNATSNRGVFVTARMQGYNGTTLDLWRSNINASLHGSAATGTGTVNTDITNFNGRYITIHANVTNYNGGSVLFKLQTQDANGIFYDIPLATTGAVTSGADIILEVGPNSWPANATPVFYANQHLPRLIRIVQTVATATVTFSASYEVGTS